MNGYIYPDSGETDYDSDKVEEKRLVDTVPYKRAKDYAKLRGYVNDFIFVEDTINKQHKIVWRCVEGVTNHTAYLDKDKVKTI